MHTHNDSQRIRWPLIAVTCLAAVLVYWLLFTLKHAEQRDVKSVGEQEPKDVEGTSGQTTISSGQAVVSTAESIRSPRQKPTPNDYSAKVQKMVELAASAGMTEDVEKAIHEVAAFGNSAIPELKRLVQSDQSAHVREAAARALAEIGTPQSIATLIDAVLVEQNDEQRRALASSLHALDNSAPAAELANALLKSQDQIVIPTIRDTLGRVADAPATRTIAQAFHDNAHEGWQQSNLMGVLLRVSLPDAIPALREIVMQDVDSSLRSQAAIALGRIGTPEAIQALLDAIGQSQSVALRQVYVESLGAVNNKESLNDLAGLLNRNTNESVRYAAATALGNIPNETSATILTSALSSEPSQTVKETIESSLNKLTKANGAQTN